MTCAHCHHKIAGGTARYEVFLGASMEVSTVCSVCYNDNAIPMYEARWCSRCEIAIPEDSVYYHDGENLTEDAPYIEDPLCQNCYQAIADEYGIDDYPDQPEEPQLGPTGAEDPPDKDYQMDV